MVPADNWGSDLDAQIKGMQEQARKHFSCTYREMTGFFGMKR